MMHHCYTHMYYYYKFITTQTHLQITAVAHFMNVNAALAGKRTRKANATDNRNNNADKEDMPETSGNLLKVNVNNGDENENTVLSTLVLERNWDAVVERCNTLQFAHEAFVWMTSTITVTIADEEIDQHEEKEGMGSI